VESTCRGIAKIACTRGIEAIYTWYKKYMKLLLLLEVVVNVVGEGDSCVKKEESATTEEHGRGTMQ